MTETYQRTLKVISQQKKSDPGLFEFFQTLLYGNWAQKKCKSGQLKNYNILMRKQSQCVVYLHQKHIEFLICIDKNMTGYRKYFNIKNIEISQLHSAYEMDSNLQRDKYLILSQRHEQTILLFESPQTKNHFKNNLQKLGKIMRSIPNLYDPIVLKSFIKADTNQNDQISWEQLKNLVRMVKIDLNESLKQQIKKILKKDRIQRIYFSEFQKMWKILYCRPELIGLFQKYNQETFSSHDEYLVPKLDIKEFKNFLINEQKQTEEQSTRIIKQLYEKENISLSFYDFCHYIYGPANNLLNERYKNELMDTTKPLNHYFCYSSHNTYLTGDQLFSSSRAERYLVDLQNGLRCVEIDVHDGSDCPIVKHGYTPTPSVNFDEVIKSVRRFIDLEPNHTPIILSIENHCNQKNQIQMSQILQGYLGDKILRVNPDLKHFPNLKDCIGKVIIKGPGNFKLFYENMQNNQNVLQDSCSEQELQQTKESQPNQNRQTLLKRKDSVQENRKTINRRNSLQEGIDKSKSKTNKQNFHKKYKVSGKFLEIICMLSKSKLQNLQNCHWESLSFNQEKINKFFQNPNEIQNIRKLSYLKWFRSYPAGMRIWSSNYDPLPALQLGVQIVAANTQTQDDVNNHILKALFMKGLNKTSGYRLKPNFLQLKENQTLQQNNTIKIQNQSLTNVSINFIAGLRIYQNEDDFKSIPPVGIRAYFTGTKRDNQLNHLLLAEKPYTEVLEKQAFNPKFLKSQTIEIKCRDPELGFLVVRVPQCGRAVIPIESMRHGWRVFSLYDHQLRQKQSKILCQIKISKQVR